MEGYLRRIYHWFQSGAGLLYVDYDEDDEEFWGQDKMILLEKNNASRAKWWNPLDPIFSFFEEIRKKMIVG